MRAALGLVTTCVLSVGTISERSSARAQLIDLGLPGVARSSAGEAINNNGTVIVRTSGIGSQPYLRAPDGTYTPVAPPPGSTSVELFHINDSGVTVGRTHVDGRFHGVIRDPAGTYSFVGLDQSHEARNLNDAGEVAGSLLGDDAIDSVAYFRGAGGHVTMIPGLEPDQFSRAVAINNHGVVVGSTSAPPPGGGTPVGRAFTWTPGTGLRLLPTLGTSPTEPVDVNDAGQVVGAVALRAVRWEPDGTITTLPAPSGSAIAGNGINAAGDVVGTGLASIPIALYWPAEGGAIDLNSLLTPQEQIHWQLRQANDINDQRQIVGSGRYDPDGPGPMPFETRGFLLNVPEPALVPPVVLAVALMTRRAPVRFRTRARARCLAGRRA